MGCDRATTRGCWRLGIAVPETRNQWMPPAKNSERPIAISRRAREWSHALVDRSGPMWAWTTNLCLYAVRPSTIAEAAADPGPCVFARL
jgi:hypothetical protein